MPHGVSLINTIAAGLGFALVFGFLAAKLRLPALVGYLLAGVIIGPFTPGFVADAGIAAQLAEIGVMLLMFGVGLHFSLDDLLAVRKIALPGALAQIAVATVICTMAPGTAILRTASRSSREKCNPTPNISSITPISASWLAISASATKPGVNGPMITPASR
jgi:Kef-type K+ transport system membrane component KefB